MVNFLHAFSANIVWIKLFLLTCFYFDESLYYWTYNFLASIINWKKISHHFKSHIWIIFHLFRNRIWLVIKSFTNFLSSYKLNWLKHKIKINQIHLRSVINFLSCYWMSPFIQSLSFLYGMLSSLFTKTSGHESFIIVPRYEKGATAKLVPIMNTKSAFSTISGA